MYEEFLHATYNVYFQEINGVLMVERHSVREAATKIKNIKEKNLYNFLGKTKIIYVN